MELFFTDAQRINANTAGFDEFESQHIRKTLRKQTGDRIDFTDGKGNLYHGIIARLYPDLLVEYDQISRMPLPQPQIFLGVGFIKHSRMDILIEKGTELGITNFYFFSSKNSNYYTENITRWTKICRQAIKQSLRYYLPCIQCFKHFTDLLTHAGAIPQKLIAHQNAAGTFTEIANSISNNSANDILILIGPEGGFTDDEIRLAHQANFVSVSFGEQRLRTETAAIAAAAGINFLRH